MYWQRKHFDHVATAKGVADGFFDPLFGDGPTEWRPVVVFDRTNDGASVILGLKDDFTRNGKPFILPGYEPCDPPFSDDDWKARQ